MNLFIFIFIFIITLSKINSVEYGKEIIFDKDNNKFILTFPQNGVLLVSVKINTPNLLIFRAYFNKRNILRKVETSGLGIIVPFEKGYTNSIVIDYKESSNEKGIIWMNPSTNEIKVNLNEIYEWKYDVKETITDLNLKSYNMTYSIDNAEKDALLVFKYNNKFKIEDNLMASNPLIVCHRKKCKSNITSYIIKKGESYKIYININYMQIKSYYYLPSFSFRFTKLLIIEKKETPKGSSKKRNNFFIILIIILLCLIGLGILFLYRKNIINIGFNNQNTEKNVGDNMKFELEHINENDMAYNVGDDLD